MVYSKSNIESSVKTKSISITGVSWECESSLESDKWINHIQQRQLIMSLRSHRWHYNLIHGPEQQIYKQNLNINVFMLKVKLTSHPTYINYVKQKGGSIDINGEEVS